MQITNRASILNSRWRYDPDTGFLRCTAGILKAGVMVYARHEVEDANPPHGIGESVRLYVPQSELEDQESISSLEGAPASVNHIWQSAGNIKACGSIAGRPFIDGDHLIADILITDSAAVRRVMLDDQDSEKLTEISSAGDWSITWQEGVTDHGEPYDGFFTNIRFNHVALLPAGAGRAGASVRIINTKEVAKMSEYTRVKCRGGKTVRVLNEDVEKLEEVMNEADAEVKNAVSPEELNAALEELAALKAETAEKNTRIAELEGTVQAFKDQLEAAMSPDQIEEAAAEMTEEREEATAVMNAHGLKPDDSTKKLRGHGLRSKVVNSVRVKNGKPELGAEELKDEGYVKGMYKALVELSASAKPVVTGANVVTIENDKGEKKVVNMSNNAERAKRLYGPK